MGANVGLMVVGIDCCGPVGGQVTPVPGVGVPPAGGSVGHAVVAGVGNSPYCPFVVSANDNTIHATLIEDRIHRVVMLLSLF